MDLVYHYFNFLLLWTLEKRDIMRNILKLHQQNGGRINFILHRIWRGQISSWSIFSPVSTVNIPNKKANSPVLTNERKKKLDWFKHVACWICPRYLLVFINNRWNGDIVPYFTSVLLLLRQNIGNFRTQKQCIEIVAWATTFLKPGQTVVDTDEQRDYNKCILISLDKGSTFLCLVEFI